MFPEVYIKVLYIILFYWRWWDELLVDCFLFNSYIYLLSNSFHGNLGFKANLVWCILWYLFQINILSIFLNIFGTLSNMSYHLPENAAWKLAFFLSPQDLPWFKTFCGGGWLLHVISGRSNRISCVCLCFVSIISKNTFALFTSLHIKRVYTSWGSSCP